MLPPLENGNGGSGGSGGGYPPYVPPPTGQTGGGVPGIPSNKPTTGVPMNTYRAYTINWQDNGSEKTYNKFFAGQEQSTITVEKLIEQGWTLNETPLETRLVGPGGNVLVLNKASNSGSQTPGFSLAGMNLLVVVALIGAAWYAFFRKA